MTSADLTKTADQFTADWNDASDILFTWTDTGHTLISISAPGQPPVRLADLDGTQRRFASIAEAIRTALRELPFTNGQLILHDWEHERWKHSREQPPTAP